MTPLVRFATAGRPEARILDCGCGTGSNLDLLARFGRAYGFDLSETGVLIGRNAGRKQLARGSVAAVPFSSGSFDLVTSFDVLYALDEKEEGAALSEMRRLLRPGGFALINVAAMDILRGDHSVLSRELRRYSATRLARLVEDAGLEIVRLTYTNQILFLPLLLVRWAHRRRGLAAPGEATREISLPPPPLNAILSAMLWCEGLWVRWLDQRWFGSSLLCLARRPEGGPRAHAGRSTSPSSRLPVR